ncbi:hypothetical protein [Methylocystis sp.]|uniref:hypothetical protein n=1 Tax=Methylocystis sp. TaxID=1911079 RepID=UPI002736AAD0|nr:hypothetical protein [Methylocystis sp.]MDP3554825.1 hypothetical protein [Methylocystis sp.]
MANPPGALPTFGMDPVDSTGGTNYTLPVGGAEAQWGRAWGAVSAQLDDWTFQSARRDAIEAGAMAGLDPNFRPGVGPILQGAAYNAAAIKVYENGLETKTRTSLDGAHRAYMELPEDQRDPKQLAAALDKVAGQIEKADVFDEVRPSFQLGAQRLTANYLADADRDRYRRELDQAKAATIANASSASDTAHRLASLPAAKDEDIGAQIAAHDKLLDDAVNQNQISAADAQIRKEKFKQSVATTRAMTLFEDLPQEARPAALEKFKSAYAGGDYYARLRAQESGGNDAAKADGSSAQGRYQFTDGTWRDMIAAHPDLGLTVDGRADPAQQEKAVRALTGDNAATLSAAGFDASGANLYMAHFLGGAGATKFLSEMAKNPDADAAKLFPEAAKANPKVFGGRTLGEVYDLQTRRFAGLAGKDATAPLSNDSFDWLTAKMEQRVRADAHLAQTAQRAALHEIGAAKKQIADGYDVTPDEWSRLSSAYAGSPDETTRAAFDQASRVRATLAAFVGKRPEEVEAQIASMQSTFKDGGAPQDRELIADASKWLTAYRSDLAKDPVQRYARDFGVSLAPLDFSSADNLKTSLAARLPVAQQAAQAYGLPAPRFLLESEKAAFKTLAANGGPQMIEAAGAAMRALGPNGAQLLKEVGGDNAPAFVAAARVSAWGGDKEFLRDFSEWHRLSSDPATRKGLELPKRERAYDVLDKALGPSLLAMPELAASVRTAAVQAYEVRALRNGWDKTLNDPAASAELSRAANQALGATYDGDVQYGGVATRKLGYFGKEHLLAPGHLRADRLGDVIASLTDDDLKALPSPPLYADNRPANARAIAGSRLVSVGRGKYAVASGDPLARDTTYLKTADGSRFTLDLNALEERLRARVRGAYK